VVEPTQGDTDQYLAARNLNDGSDGWWITTNQLSGPADSDPPAHFTQKQFLEAFTRGTVWEVGRARVGEDAVAVWKTRVQGEVRTLRTSGPVQLTFKACRGMKEAAAVDVVNSWGLSGVASGDPTGTLGWLAANIGGIVGQPAGSTHTLERCPWQERECAVTVPGDRTHPAISRTAFYLALVEVLETHDLYGTVISSQVCYTRRYLAGYQIGWALDPRRAVHPCRCRAPSSGSVVDDS